MEQPPHAGEGEIARLVVPVEGLETPGLGLFARVRLHDAGPRQIFLGEVGDLRELGLDLLEALVDLPAEDEHDGREDDHRDHRPDREHGIDPDHEPERERRDGGGVHRVHDRGSGDHADRLDIVRRAAHQIARAPGVEELRREPEEVREEGAPDIRLHAAAQPVEQLAHPESRRAGHDGNRREHESVAQDEVGVEFPFQRVDRHLEHPGACDREQVAHDHERKPGRDTQAVRAEVG